MPKQTALTICSVNYLAKALVLIETYLSNHPNHIFNLVLVDKKIDGFEINKKNLNIIWVEDLGIPNFFKWNNALGQMRKRNEQKPKL
jgi:hypothetical protein